MYGAVIGSKAQTLAEYSILAVIIIAAVVGMQLYVKRGLQAKYKNVVDVTGNCVSNIANTAYSSQYEPYYVSSGETVTYNSTIDYNYDAAAGSLTRVVNEATVRNAATVNYGFDLSADDDW